MAKIDKAYEDGFVDHSLTLVEVQWCKLVTPDTAFNKNQWQMDALLNDEQADTLQKAGFNVKTKDGKQFITLKRNVIRNDGTKNNPPNVVGPDLQPFTEDIGNGSVCNINFSGRKWGVSKTVTAYIGEVQVVKHVPYGGGNSFQKIEDTDGVLG